MDWSMAIDRKRQALKRVLAMLLAMAGLGAGGVGAGGRFTFFRQKGAAASGFSRAEKNKLSPALTLSRHLYWSVLRLLRPAEAAVRRLIVVAARDLIVTLPPPRLRKPKPARKVRRPGRLAKNLAPHVLSLPLFDRLRPWFGGHAWRRASTSVPRISIAGFGEPVSIKLRGPDDPVDAARLALRLQALAAALDDLPGQAERLARWKARRDAELVQHRQAGGRGAQDGTAGKASRRCRLSPLKPGRPPGWRRKPVHEVHGVLNEVHGLAVWALNAPDTS